jgi:hypothetical protein
MRSVAQRTVSGNRAPAQYVRISTEHQQFCNPNQANKIREYAERRGIAIVYTYADEGNLTRSRWTSTTPATRFTAGNNSPCSTPMMTGAVSCRHVSGRIPRLFWFV